MVANGTEISLAEAVKFVVDNRGRSAPVEKSGIPLIATNCISNENLYPVYERLRYVSDETYQNWFRSHPEPCDIILTNKGSQNGAICLVPDPVEFCIAQDMVALRADEEKIDPLYLFSALRSNLVQSRIKNLNVDAVIPHFKKTDFDKLLIPYPTRRDQEYIGHVYYEFSRKIELNRQMNATLEAMAQALFKSWFVDFDPVIDNAQAAGHPIPEPLHARAEARKALGDKRKPLPEAIQKQFPNRFVFNEEMGWVPEGWRVGTLEDLVVLQRGFDLPKTKRTEGVYPNGTYFSFLGCPFILT
ncbi:MAG: restriction endonuclease subunit S, partial [Chromatiales bacterium]